MPPTGLRQGAGAAVAAAVFVGAVAATPAPASAAPTPSPGVIYQLGDEPCLKGRGNCAIYVKSAQLPSGRIVASFEQATVAASGSADGETLPVYASDDSGSTWRLLSQVAAPAYLSDDPAVAPYTSNWTNPFLYVLPQDVGELTAGTLLLASVVSGDDHFYREHKAADPAWVPDNDGDRSDMAIALFASRDEGSTWDVVGIVATGGWQGGSAGAGGTNVAAANTHRQVDPLWEPYLMVHEGELVCFYSDEDEYTGFDPVTGVAQLATDNGTAEDPKGQVLLHRTWDGRSPHWSDPVVDVPGAALDAPGGGSRLIGGGRPGMATVVPTTDGRWLMTYEYWGGGDEVRYKLADDPLRFFATGDETGEGISGLPVAEGSSPLARGGSPVTVALPDGRLLFNASGSGDVWVNASGRSDGVWTERTTPVGAAYSRTLQPVAGTNRVVILGDAGASTIVHGEVDVADRRTPATTWAWSGAGLLLVVGLVGLAAGLRRRRVARW